MDLVEDFAEPGVSMVAACSSLGVSRATLYRGTHPAPPLAIREYAPSPRRLGDDERQAIVDAMHSEEFVDQPPMEMFAKLLSRGVYLASIRTIYRVLAELGESKERRNQRLPHPYVKPSLTATGPNQVWTWDITKLATLEKGVFLHAYVIIDLFSRYVVGWMVAAKECKHLAAQLFAEAAARHGIEPGLIVHADRGAAMKSDTLAQLSASRSSRRSNTNRTTRDSSPLCFTRAVGSSPFSVGTTTSIIILGSRYSHPRTSSSGASWLYTPRAKRPSTPHTPDTPNASRTAHPRPLCPPQRCTSTRSKPRRSWSTARSHPVPLQTLTRR